MDNLGGTNKMALAATRKMISPKLVVWAIISAILVCAATINAVANITRRKAPAIALSVIPGEPVALAAAAERQFTASQSPASLAAVDRLLRQAVRQQPLHPAAIRLFGYSADIKGKPVAARNALMLAARLSRRDFGTQLWLIEDAVRDGNNGRALVHYDIALRTTISSRPILFPTLTDALAEPAIRRALVPYVRKGPNWMPAFLYDATAATENPENVAALLLAAGNMTYRGDFSNVPNAVLNRLATKSRFAAFQAYFLSLPKASPATLGAVDLDKKTVGLEFAPAGWQISEGASVGGNFSPAEKQGRFRLDAFASSGERGTVMHKFVFLQPGQYRMVARHGGLEDAPDARVDWTMQCVAGEKATPVGVASVPVVGGTFAAEMEFAVPASGCDGLMLVLQAAGGSAQGGAEFSVDRITLERQ